MDRDTSRDTRPEATRMSGSTDLNTVNPAILYGAYVVDDENQSLIYPCQQFNEFSPAALEASERIKVELGKTYDSFALTPFSPASDTLHRASEHAIKKQFKDLIKSLREGGMSWMNENTMKLHYVPETHREKFSEIINRLEKVNQTALIIIDSSHDSHLTHTSKDGTSPASDVIISNNYLGEVREDILKDLSKFIRTTQKSIDEGSFKPEVSDLNTFVQRSSASRFGCIVMSEDERKVFEPITAEVPLLSFKERVGKALPSFLSRKKHGSSSISG